MVSTGMVGQKTYDYESQKCCATYSMFMPEDVLVSHHNLFVAVFMHIAKTCE